MTGPAAAAPRRCLAIRHLGFEDLGVFEPELLRLGFSVHYRQAGVEVLTLNEWQHADLVVVLGGPLGVSDQARYPWMPEQCAAMGRRLQAGKPLLGICLGAQMMAAALGARVLPGPAKELGWAHLALTAQGAASPLVHLSDTPVLHWHGDQMDLPVGAHLLAHTATTPVQAFSLGRHALALQFHAEVNAAELERWLIGHALELSLAGIHPQQLRDGARRHGAALARSAQAMLRQWWAGTGLPPPN